MMNSVDQLRARAKALLQEYQETFTDIRRIDILENLTHGDCSNPEVLKALETILEDYEALFKISQRWKLHEYLRHVHIDYSRNGIALEGILNKQFPISNCRTTAETQVRFTVDSDIITDYRLNKSSGQLIIDNLEVQTRIGVLYLFLQKEEVTLISVPGEMKFIAEFE